MKINIGFLCHNDYYVPQTTEEIENEKDEKNEEYLETRVQYHAKEIKNLNDIENEDKRNLFIETTIANEGMIVDSKITFEDCYTVWYI